MIIGCYNDDGTPIEQVDLSEKGRAYELEVCIVKHPRRYPEYKVDYSSLAFCSSRESAEKIKDEILQSGEEWLKDIYCWYIYERVLDVNYDRSEYMACWLYNESGAMIDKRLFPSYWSEDGFIGRSEDEIRFKFGDLVELYDGDTVRLAYVLASPRKKEWYVKKTEENGEPYVGDVSDDTYTIIVKVGKGQSLLTTWQIMNMSMLYRSFIRTISFLRTSQSIGRPFGSCMRKTEESAMAITHYLDKYRNGTKVYRR